MLQELVDKSAGNIEQVTANAVPVINRVSAGYPRDFTDLGYPPRVADDYVSCPDVSDRDAFAARVHGDSMVPKYREGDIVIFSPAALPARRRRLLRPLLPTATPLSSASSSRAMSRANRPCASSRATNATAPKPSPPKTSRVCTARSSGISGWMTNKPHGRTCSFQQHSCAIIT